MKINYDINRTMKAFPRTQRISSEMPFLAEIACFTALTTFIMIVAYMVILGANNELSVIKQVNQHYKGE